MKILVISAAFPPLHAGEATNAYYLCRQLVDRKHEVHVLASEGNSGNGDTGITVHPIMRAWSWSEAPRLKAFLKQCSPDAILLMYLGLMYRYHPMVTYSATIAKRMFPGVPFVTRFENVALSSDPARTSFLSRLFRKFAVKPWAGKRNLSYSFGSLLRDSDHIIALCRQHQSVLYEELPSVRTNTVLIPPPPNIRIVRNVSDEARRRQRARLGLKPEDFVIVFLGYIYPAKGVETLLRGFQLVTKRTDRAKLLFVGGKFGLDEDGEDSYVRRMLRLCKDLGLEQSTIWTGEFKAEEEEASLNLQAADVGVFTFVQGVQLNNSSFSSMAAHGLPIVATRGPWLDHPFMHGDNVLLCNPNDPLALAGSILRIMEDSALRVRLSQGALNLAEEWFSWERATERTVELLSGVMPRPSS